jgi:hypothetical protein
MWVAWLTPTMGSLAHEVHRLKQTLETGSFDARDLKPIVSRLLDDARHTLGTMRGERPASRGEQETWQRIVEILTRMQELL